MGFLTTRETTFGPFETEFFNYVDGLGGTRNFHAHLDRAGTLAREYLAGFDTNPLQAASTMSLRRKQFLMGELHRGCAYRDAANLEGRMRECLDDMIRQGIREVISFIDAAPDIGLQAIETAAKLRRAYAERIIFKIAAHPIFGFREDSDYPRSRWEVFEEACGIADIVGSLPEKDERADSIGYDGHLRRTLELAIRLGKPYHAHVDQENSPDEYGTRTLIEAVRWLGSPKVTGAENGEPTVWAIHAISPSAYNEGLFREVVEGLVKYRIGVIVCPSAALSMRQRREVLAPTHNSIARGLEMALAGVEIRLGSDNESDVFVPTYVTMIDEVRVLANAWRFYDIPVLAKIASGTRLNATNRDTIERHLEAARG